MRYSIRMKEGWISDYNRLNASFGVSVSSKERIRCSYELANLICSQLRSKGIASSLQAEAPSYHMNEK